MKTILEKRKARLESKRDALKTRALASEDVNEVRAINEQLEDISAEIAEIVEEIAEEERSANTVPSNAQSVNAGIVGSFAAPAKEERKDENPLESMEYRTSFMNYVLKGEPIKRAGEAISTVDTAPAIPLTIMNDVINTVRKRYGNLYAKVRKTSMQGGVEYPIGALQATFKWITEATVSPRQKLDPLAKVSFSYHTAEIRIAQTFLSSLVTLSAFEARIAEVIAVAYLQAMDYGIVRGTGNGQMLGILNDPRVTTQDGGSHIIGMTSSKINNWKDWRKDFFAKLPLGYRGGEFIFNLGTVDAYLETMSDDNNNPVFRQATGLEVNDGDAANPNGRFFGREIALVEDDILPSFDDANANDIIGIYWQPNEYAVNENFGFTMRRYFDEETNEWVDKAIVVVDGKVLNPKGFYLIKKSS